MRVPTCNNCGSTEVLVDAYAFWNTENQQWEVQNTFDKGSVCENCGGECAWEWKETNERTPT